MYIISSCPTYCLGFILTEKFSIRFEFLWSFPVQWISNIIRWTNKSAQSQCLRVSQAQKKSFTKVMSFSLLENFSASSNFRWLHDRGFDFHLEKERSRTGHQKFALAPFQARTSRDQKLHCFHQHGDIQLYQSRSSVSTRIFLLSYTNLFALYYARDCFVGQFLVGP